MVDLKKYIVGGKLKDTKKIILRKTAWDKCNEDCFVLIIPESDWDELKKEKSDG